MSSYESCETYLRYARAQLGARAATMLDLVSCAGGPALALLAAIVTHSNRRVGCEWIRLDPPRPAAAHWAPAGGDGIVRLSVGASRS